MVKFAYFTRAPPPVEDTGHWSKEGLAAGASLFLAACLVLTLLCKCCACKRGKTLSSPRRLERGRGSSPLLIRSTFNRIPMIRQRPSKNHTHPISAALRSTGSNFIERFAEDIGRKPFYYQCSAADQRRGRDGSRKHYWVKDLIVQPAPMKLEEDHVLALVDVDYYVDMRDFLVKHFRPTLLYSFQPERVASSENEYSFTFDKYNNLVYRHSGGGLYKHKVWNYGVDNLIVYRPGSLCSLRLPQVATFLVDKRNVGPDHDIICLTPLKKWSGLRALWATRNLSGNYLERLNVTSGDFTRLYLQRCDGLYVSTGMVNQFSEATVPVAYDEALATVQNTNKVPLSLPVVLGYVPGDDMAERKARASVLLRYHLAKHPLKTPPTSFPVKDAVREFDLGGVDNYVPNSKPVLVPFMAPFIHGAFAPVNNLENEKACISGRIVQFADKAASMRMTSELDKIMREFAKLVFPTPHLLHPVTLDEVYSRQSRPSQKRILDRSMNEEPKREIRMFMKKEAYGSIKDPRPISQINGTDKRDYSTYIYAVADTLKQQPWYAFGITPREIANRVTQIASEAETCVNSDFSRFDGRVSPLLRELERIILMRAFDGIYAADLNELHSSQFNQSAVGTFGTRYKTGTARASGSPETSAFNTLANAFVAFLAFRTTKVNDAFIHAEEAWERLGIYGGDDGLTADIDTTRYVRAANQLGMKLDVQQIHRGDLGVTFLARMYGPDVWHGDNNSCCDIPRQLSKFHTTVSLPANVSPLAKLLEKARAFALTDRNTPVIGEFVSKIIGLVGILRVMETPIYQHIWNSEHQFKDQYPNLDSGWMTDYATQSLARHEFSYSIFVDWLTDVRHVEQCLSPPLCSEPKQPAVDREVIVDGDVLSVLPYVPRSNQPRTIRGRARGGPARAAQPRGSRHAGKRRGG